MAQDDGAPAEHACTLLGGPFEWAVQCLLALFALFTLWYKRHLESHRTPNPRPWIVWALDCSKQAYASGLQHGINLLFGITFADSASECAWYLTNFAVSVGCGVGILSAVMPFYHRMVERNGWTILRSGEYGSPPSWKPWLAQSLAWGFLASGEKCVTALCVILPLRTYLDAFSAWAERPLLDYPKLELILVMVVGPMVLNAIFFWLIDSLIMRKLGSPGGPPHEEMGEADVSQSYLSMSAPETAAAAAASPDVLADRGLDSSRKKPLTCILGETVGRSCSTPSSFGAGALETTGREIV